MLTFGMNKDEGKGEDKMPMPRLRARYQYCGSCQKVFDYGKTEVVHQCPTGCKRLMRATTSKCVQWIDRYEWYEITKHWESVKTHTILEHHEHLED